VLPALHRSGWHGPSRLVGVAGAENELGWSNGDVPSEHAIRGFQRRDAAAGQLREGLPRS